MMNFHTFATFDFMPVTITTQDSDRVWIKNVRARIEVQQGLRDDMRLPSGRPLFAPKWLKCIIVSDYEELDKCGLWSAMTNYEVKRVFQIESPLVKLVGCKVDPRYFAEESIISYGDGLFPYATATFPLMVDYYVLNETALQLLAENEKFKRAMRNEPETGRYIDF